MLVLTMDEGGGAAGVCRVKGLQLLIAGWYIDTGI